MFFKRRCPFCQKEIVDFIFDYETGMGKCTICNANYDLKKVFSIKDAKFLVKITKGKTKEKLMELFNLEEVSTSIKVRPWIFILFWIIFLIFVGIILLDLNKTIGEKVKCVLGIVIFGLFLFYIYKRETKKTVIKEKKNNSQKMTKEQNNKK